MQHDILASFFLWISILAVIGSVAIGFWRSPYTPLQSLLFVVAYLLVRLLWQCRLPSKLPLQPGQGAVLVCNHRSSIDPFFIQMLSTQPVHWMVAREYCESPLFGWFLRATEAIPIGRGGTDTGGSKKAIRYAAEGGLVGMFPEGRINMTEQFMLSCRPGAALIALKANAVLLPCYIKDSPFSGTPWSPFFMPTRTSLQFGEPFDLSEYQGRQKEDGIIEEIMRRCLSEIAQLAGQADFEPQFAGRKWKPSKQEVDADIAAAQQRRRNKNNAS